QVYASALAFSPARSMTRNLFKREEVRWITAGPVVEEDWNACRQTLEGHSSRVRSVAFPPDSKKGLGKFAVASSRMSVD
ncbi:hypothetical protein N656DRAFT_785132, partial [Canariomyces notabilis]